MSFWRNREIILAEILKPPLGHLQGDQIFLIKYFGDCYLSDFDRSTPHDFLKWREIPIKYLLYINSSKYFVLILTLQFSEDKSFDEAFFRIESRLSRWGDEPYPLGGGVGEGVVFEERLPVVAGGTAFREIGDEDGAGGFLEKGQVASEEAAGAHIRKQGELGKQAA
jgi:hypothetical protein